MTLQSILKSGLDSSIISSPVILAATQEEIGTVSDVLTEESGHLRYLIISVNNRQILVPVGICRSAQDSQAIALWGIDNMQDLEQLPAYETDSQIDYEYEEQVRQVYRQLIASDAQTAEYDSSSYSYDKEPNLYDISADESETIKLYEEKLVTGKTTEEIGEVTIGKRVETETKEVEIPVEKEKVVVKTKEVADEKIPVEPGEATFEEGTVAKVKVYEEKANVGVEAFVREEVEVKKEVEKEVAEFKETVRKEKLEITGEENVEVEK